MDVVRAVNNANLILPSGDVNIGPFDYNLLHQQPVSRHPRDQPDSAEDHRPSTVTVATSATRRLASDSPEQRRLGRRSAVVYRR